MTQALLDWTRGESGLVYQSCASCDRSWYFRRDFCPHCGHGSPRDRQASGLGTVHAITTVHRAPTKEMKPYAPYQILLVDLDEGVRVMAHGDADIAIDDRVQAGFVALAGRLLPRFQKLTP
jgi:uncharacterized protein